MKRRADYDGYYVLYDPYKRRVIYDNASLGAVNAYIEVEKPNQLLYVIKDYGTAHAKSVAAYHRGKRTELAPHTSRDRRKTSRASSMIANDRDLPERYREEIERAARRAVRMANARAPLDYIGIGMTGVVFCDARDHAFKVARHPGQAITRSMIAQEAEWLRVAGTVPSIRRHIARLYRYHRSAAILERECIHDDARNRGRRPKADRWDLHASIREAMKPYGFGAPEFKDDSYVYVRGRGWVLVDASMPIVMGSRLVARATEMLKGRRFLNESPSDMAYAVRMESGRSIPPAVAERLSARLEALSAQRGTPKRRDTSHPRRANPVRSRLRVRRR